MLHSTDHVPSTSEAIADAFFAKRQIHIALERAWAEAQVKPRKSCRVRCQPEPRHYTNDEYFNSIEPFDPSDEQWNDPESVRCQRCLRWALWEGGLKIGAEQYEKEIEDEVPEPQITRAWIASQGWQFGGIKFKHFWSYSVRASEILVLRETSAIPHIQRITRARRKLVPWDAPLEQIEEALFCRWTNTIEHAALLAWALTWTRYRPYDPSCDVHTIDHDPFQPPTPERIDVDRRRDACRQLKKPWSCGTQEEARLMLLWAHARGINWLDLGWLDVGNAVVVWIEDARLRMNLRACHPASTPVASRPRRGL